MSLSYRHFTDRPFGIEVELSEELLPCDYFKAFDGIAEIISFHDKIHRVEICYDYINSEGDNWDIKPDASCGLEIASYKASGLKDLENISNCLKKIGRSGYGVDESCGCHVHVDISDFSKKDVGKMLALWMLAEDVILQAVPSHRRGNEYCKPLRSVYKWILHDKISSPSNFCRSLEPHDYEERRVSLNIFNYLYSDNRTVELRLPESSLEEGDAKNWIKLLVNFVENVERSPTPVCLKSAGLIGSMKILGLHERGLVLSEDLFRTKEWFLRRLIFYSSSSNLRKQALSLLNRMWYPLRKYKLIGKCLFMER